MNRKQAAAMLMALRRRAWYAQEGRCLWCNRLMLKNKVEIRANPSLRVTAEHLIPESLGGESVIGNIVAACSKCNHRRGNRSVAAWLEMLQKEYKPPDFALLLQKLAKFGISTVIGQPAHAAPTVENPIVRAPEVEAPAPQGQPG